MSCARHGKWSVHARFLGPPVEARAFGMTPSVADFKSAITRVDLAIGEKLASVILWVCGGAKLHRPQVAIPMWQTRPTR